MVGHDIYREWVFDPEILLQGWGFWQTGLVHGYSPGRSKGGCPTREDEQGYSDYVAETPGCSAVRPVLLWRYVEGRELLDWPQWKVGSLHMPEHLGKPAGMVAVIEHDRFWKRLERRIKETQGCPKLSSLLEIDYADPWIRKEG